MHIMGPTGPSDALTTWQCGPSCVRMLGCCCECMLTQWGTRHRGRDFLREVSQLFELYIYTMGDRDYAAEMASFLDPEGLYFKGRTISKVHKIGGG